MKKLLLSVLATVFAFGMIIQSPAYADEVTTPSPTIEVVEESEEITETATPTVTVEAEPTEETTPETESSEETEVTVSLSEEATAFIQNVNDAENNKENILNAAQEYVDAYVASFDAEGEEATTAADALIAEKEEAFFNLFDQGALLDAYDALSEEEKANEDVINAKALLDALVLSVNTIMNIEEPTDGPTTYANGVTEGLAGGVPTQIDLSTVDGDIWITTNGLYTGGTASRVYTNIEYTYAGGTLVEAFNPNGYEFTGTSTDKSILVDPVTTPTTTLILNSINMTQSGYKSAIITTHTDTTIVLQTGTQNDIISTKENSNAFCIEKNGTDGKLTIKSSDGSNEGKLNASATGVHTGCIGSLYTDKVAWAPFAPKTPSNGSANFTNLNIESGTITAVAGNSHNPAIGVGCSGNVIDVTYTKICDNINISGGTVYAYGGGGGAGIGSGGTGNTVSNITISGGAQVYAYGGSYAPGIGTGGGTSDKFFNSSGKLENLVITGGETHVWATGDIATNVPGIGNGKFVNVSENDKNSLIDVMANPEVPNWATYIKYGTSATDFAYTTTADNNGAGESLATPIGSDREFATFLKAQSDAGVNVFYTEVYFGLPHDEFANTDKADIGANNYSTCAGSFNWADTNAAKTQLLSLAKVSGHDQDGNVLNEALILANIYDGGTKQAAFEAQVQAIFDANANNATGNYLLTFTYSYVDNEDHNTKTMSVSTHIQFRDACSPTVGGSNPSIAASNAIHPTGGAAWTKAELIGLTEGTASNYLGLDADLVNDITFTQSEVDAINDAKTAGETGVFPLTYTYVTTSDGTAPVTLTKKVYITLTDTGTPFTPTDPNHPENGQDMGPQIGANDYTTKTGGAAFDTTALKKIQNVSAKLPNGKTADLANIIPTAAQLATINAAKVAGQVGDFPLTYTVIDPVTGDPVLNPKTGKPITVDTIVSLRDDDGGDTPTPVEIKNDDGDVVGYEVRDPQIGANDHISKTGGAAFDTDTLKQIQNVKAKDSNGKPVDLADLTPDPTQLAAINAAKIAGQVIDLPLKYSFIDPVKGKVEVETTVSLRDDGVDGSTITPTPVHKDPTDTNSPIIGYKVDPQIGANNAISMTGGTAFDTDTLKQIQSVKGKKSDGSDVPFADLIPDPTQLAAINAAKTAGQIGDFPLKYTFEDTDGSIIEVETTVSLRDEGKDLNTITPIPVTNTDGKVVGYKLNPGEYQIGSNDKTYPTGGTGWTDDEIKTLVELTGKDEFLNDIDLADFTVDATQLATLNAEKLAGKCGRYPVKFTGPNGEEVTSYITLNGCVAPKPPVNPGPWLVTYVDCKGNTVKVEWVGDGQNSTKPNANYSDVNNVHFHYTAYPNNCGVYRVPNTGVKDNTWMYYVLGGIALVGAVILINKSKKKA